MGEGFTWETQDRERDVRAAQVAWAVAAALLREEEVALVVLGSAQHSAALPLPVHR